MKNGMISGWKSLVSATVTVVGFAMIMLLSSCFKQDTPVQLPPPGESQNFEISMGETYHRQVYFNLNTKDTLGSEHSAWDLCFESTDTGWHVWINGGNLAFAANTDTQDFDAVTSIANAAWKIDDPEWDIDSTAVADWRIDRMVYLIDRGESKPADERYKKIIFQSVNDTSYEIQFSNLDGSNLVIYDVPKKPGFQFVYFTFDNNGQMLDIEPNSYSWDLLFTHYRTVITTVYPPLPYLVTGVLINPNVAVCVDSSLNFADIDYPKALTLSYSSRRDVIGYGWKRYDFATQAYIVKPYINFIIRDMEGTYWKLHFIDFYDSQGHKGYPQFEFQRL